MILAANFNTTLYCYFICIVDLQNRMQLNNNVNHNAGSASPRAQCGNWPLSLNTMRDAIQDFSFLIGQDISANANQQPLFDVEEAMNVALDNMKQKRMDEMEHKQQTDTQMFDSVMCKLFDHMTSASNTSLSKELFGLTLKIPSIALFYQWIDTEYDEIFIDSHDIEIFDQTISEIMSNETQLHMFLQQWMLWKVIYRNNVHEILERIVEFASIMICLILVSHTIVLLIY